MKRHLMAGAAGVAICAGSASAQDFRFPIGEGIFNWDSYEAYAAEHDYSGESISITGPWTGRDKELVESVIAYFTEATGAEVQYSGSDSFEQDIVIASEANTPPNLAVFPQPGLASDLASQGELVPIGEETADWLRANYAAGDSWVDLGTYAGEA